MPVKGLLPVSLGNKFKFKLQKCHRFFAALDLSDPDHVASWRFDLGGLYFLISASTMSGSEH